MAGQTFLVTAAIDFGTTFTGYAYSFRHELENKLESQTYVNVWSNKRNNSTTVKTPTSILFDPNKAFHSFGYEAENKYVELVDDGEEDGWSFFKQFKMNLHNAKLRRDMEIKDELGCKMEAMEVFSQSIRYLTNHLYMSIKEGIPDFEQEDIFWVITVPAVWKYSAKVFMKEAALKAGLANHQMTFVHEPEAAAIYISDLKLTKEKDEQDNSILKPLEAGERFILLDLGGGTIDIFACEVQGDGSLKELCPRQGGHWGGTRVDKNILKYIEDFFGRNNFQEFRKNNFEQFFQLSERIQTAKCNIDTSRSFVSIELPQELITCKQGQTSGHISIVKNKLRIPLEDIIEAFSESKSHLIGAIEDLLDTETSKDIDTFIMVGGFAESRIMKDAITKRFPDKRLIKPTEAATAVLRGAVLYGFNQDRLHSRVLPFTCGTCTTENYVKDRHPAGCVIRNGKVDDVFKMFLRKGTDTQEDNFVVEHSVMSGLYEANVEIYLTSADNLPDPSFITDPVFERVGTITIPVESKQMIDIRMSVGHFDIRIEAKEHDSVEWRDVSFDFM